MNDHIEHLCSLAERWFNEKREERRLHAAMVAARKAWEEAQRRVSSTEEDFSPHEQPYPRMRCLPLEGQPPGHCVLLTYVQSKVSDRVGRSVEYVTPEGVVEPGEERP